MGTESEKGPPRITAGAGPERPRSSAERERRNASDPSLRDVLRSVGESRRLVGGTAIAALALAGAYLFVAPPVYRSRALLEVGPEPTAVAGLDTLRRPGDAERPPAEADVERMRARSVIGPVVDGLALGIGAEPRRLPVLGDALARRRSGAGLAPPLPWLARYAWGGERISVAQLEVSDDLAGVPMRLVAIEEGRYRVLDRNGAPVVEGKVGAPAASPARGVKLLVTELVARPGTHFRLEKLRRDEVIDALDEKLTVQERGKDTGIIEMRLDGRDASRVAAIVSALASEAVRQNAEKRAGEVARALELEQEQIPGVKARLEAAEAALSAFRVQQGTADLTIEAKAVIERVAELQKELTDVDTLRSQLRDKYTERYPDVIAIERRAARIRAALSRLDERIRALPATELRSTRLARDARIATEQYVALLDRVQVLRVAKAGEIGSVRIVDGPVVARKPVGPKAAPVLLLALVVGVGGGVAAALLRRALGDDPDDDSQEIESATGLPVLVTVPHSEREARLQRGACGGDRVPLAAAAPDDLATESLRTLRTVLAFLLNARGNVVAIGSPSPGVGKSFVCANLAHLLASAGKRVLLVDADLRRGALHRTFAVGAQPGLSEVLSDVASIEEATRKTGTTGLEILPCGRIPSHPAELLARPRLEDTLAEVSRRYDAVIVDSGPILAVTDPLLVARCANVNLLVLRAGRHPLPEISLTLERLARGGAQVHGAIVNDAYRVGGRYGRVYEHRASQGEAPVAALP